MSNYDADESYAAGDEDELQFDNARLNRIKEILEEAIPEPLERLGVWQDILKAIYGDAELI